MKTIPFAAGLEFPLDVVTQKLARRPAAVVDGCTDLDALAVRFWRYTQIATRDECWRWTGASVRGYGVLRLSRVRRNILAHRLSFVLFVGDLEPNELACHRCDTPGCVNPRHLFAGSQDDNMHDASVKGRLVGRAVAVGERQHLAKLNAELVGQIRQRKAAGESLNRLAVAFGVSKGTIAQVVLRKTWRHV